VVYYGEARDILAYFDELGYVCPSHVNPADYFRTEAPLAHFNAFASQRNALAVG
jgi:hypothetical protein